MFGIGGELGVPCTTKRRYGGLNALGGESGRGVPVGGR